MVNANQPKVNVISRGVIDDKLSEAVRAYRKRAHMTQGLFGEFCGISPKTIGRIEKHEPVEHATLDAIREFLQNAPSYTSIRNVPKRPKRIYLTEKLLTWARVANMSTDGLEAIRALKERYDYAKVHEGLASIPLIQLEVENALTLATRGAYYRRRYE